MRPTFRGSPGELAFVSINTLAMLIICFLTIYPIWYVIVYSFNDGQDAMRGGIFWWPREFSTANYEAVFRDGRIMTAFAVTIAKTVTGVVVHVFFTAMVAYAISRRELIGRNFYLLLGTVTLFFGGGLIPTYLLIRDLQLLDTFLVYIIPVMFSFYDLIIFQAFFREIPDGLEEAARIDGANDLKVFTSVIIPVSMPVVATIALFHGVFQWNDYFTGVLYINNQDLLPIQTFLYRVIAQSGSSDLVNGLDAARRTVTLQSVKLATMVVTTAPIVFIYPFLQKHFVKGLMIGSIKG